MLRVNSADAIIFQAYVLLPLRRSAVGWCSELAALAFPDRVPMLNDMGIFFVQKLSKTSKQQESINLLVLIDVRSLTCL
jgi:hypothetical protein